MPLSSRWQLWVRGREGPPLPQSASPGPRAYEYERHPSFNRQWSATVLSPLTARGPPRSNICGMRMSSLASPFILMRGSCHLRTSCRVGIGCDSLSADKRRIKSQEPSLLGIFYYPPAPPKGDFNLLARSSTEVCSIPLPLHIRCAPVSCPLHSAHIFRGLAAKRDCSLRALRSSLTTALQSQTRRWYRCAMCLCPAALFAAAVSSIVTQRLSAFRSYLAPAYRLCYAPRLSAESSEPSGKEAVPSSLPPVSSALTASSRSASSRSLTSRWRPDSFDSPSLALYLDADVGASGGKTVSTSNHPHPVRRLPRRTGLPAHILRDSVRFAPRDSQDVEPDHTDARPDVVPNFTGITRPEGTSRI